MALKAIGYIPKGTVMLFAQPTTPIGWTKLTTHTDKALRIVSGNVSSGGTDTFSSIFGLIKKSTAVTVSATTLSYTQVESHVHGSYKNNGSGTSNAHSYNSNNKGTGINTSTVGTGGSHTHVFSAVISVAYIDVIFCQKD